MRSVIKKSRPAMGVSEKDGGFTLIELLIVIVILGILAAIVAFSLSGTTGQASVAACQSDAKTVATAVAAFQADNPSPASNLTSSAAAWQSTLTTKADGVVGSPFLQSWPSSSSYTISVAVGTETYADSTTTTAVATAGDVLVTAKGVTYDATKNPVAACATA
jgi:prepilin-type N-terminal cleavage/methylation domain-containing protein